MSKSLGNSLTIKQALEKYNHEVIRYAMLEKHYATQIDLNEGVFSLAEKQLYYFYNTIAKMDEFVKNYGTGSTGKIIDVPFVKSIEKNFEDAMDDDFNTSAAIANLFAICKSINALIANKKHPKEDISQTLTAIKTEIVRVFSILGLLQQNPSNFACELRNKHLELLGISPESIEETIQKRIDAKADKKYALADELRNMLLEKGIILNDSKDGTTWDIKELYSIAIQ
jgi:cysteinyl-tRNA synthetase